MTITGAYPQTARNTPSRKSERATYDREAVHELLDEAYLCHLGFVVDGEPRVLPTLFVRVDEIVYLHASTGSRWALAARGDGIPVCLEVSVMDALILARSQMHHSANYRAVVAHGVARLVTDKEEKLASLAALIDKVGQGRSAHTRPPNAGELAQTAVLSLPLEDVSMKSRDAGVADDAEDLDLPYWAGVVPLRTVREPAVPDAGVTVPAPDYVTVS